MSKKSTAAKVEKNQDDKRPYLGVERIVLDNDSLNKKISDLIILQQDVTKELDEIIIKLNELSM